MHAAMRLAAGPAVDPARVAGLKGLAATLNAGGRTAEARLLLEHLEALQVSDVATLRELARLLGREGRTLEAIEKLVQLKSLANDPDMVLEDIRAQLPAAFARFNECVAAGRVEEAETYASALAGLVPGNAAIVGAALSCNVALGRSGPARTLAAALLKLDPANASALAALGVAAQAPSVTPEAAAVAPTASPAGEVHPLIRLRDLYDAASAMMCGEVSAAKAAEVEALLKAARGLVVETPAGSEFEGWAKHYRLAVDAIDVPFMLGETPASGNAEPISFATATGAALDWDGLQAKAKRLGAKAVFFAAADRGYVDLYARWYIKSILKYSDVKCLIVVHVIGGAGELEAVAKALDIADERLVFAGDAFDAAGVATKCYDAPPKGLIAKPVAHFQSVRFLRLGALLAKLKLPVFVSDIDLLLQRGVADLLARCEGADVVLNENDNNTNAGSRLTANLVLVNPTANAALFLRFLKGYLERMLAGAEVSRWIDQFALLLGRHHLRLHGKAPQIGYFDTTSDINNVMYRSYEANPFRFLSLYHGFDTSSLEGKSEVLGEGVVQAKPKTAKAPARKKAQRK